MDQPSLVECRDLIGAIVNTLQPESEKAAVMCAVNLLHILDREIGQLMAMEAILFKRGREIVL